MDKVIRYDFEYISATTVVDAEATSATVCWPYSATVCDNGDGTCKSYIKTGTYCEDIALTPVGCPFEYSALTINGSTTWENTTLFYKIKRNEPTCKDVCSGSTYEYSNVLDSWLDYPIVKCGESEDDLKRKLYYTYKEISKNNCDEIIDISEKTSSKEVTLTNESNGLKSGTTRVEIQEELVTYYYRCLPCGECHPGETEYNVVNITQDLTEIDATTSDTEINYSIEWTKTSYDDDCNETISRNVTNGKWIINGCSCNNNRDCCEDRIDEEDIELVEGIFSATLSCVVKGDKKGKVCSECSPSTCQTEVSYCVSTQQSGVLGITYYWVYNQISGLWGWKRGNGSSFMPITVPREGGKIKIQYPYTAYTINYNCSQTISVGTDEKIIEIPPHESKCNCEISYLGIGGRSGQVQFIGECGPGIETISGWFIDKPAYSSENCSTKVRYTYLQEYGTYESVSSLTLYSDSETDLLDFTIDGENGVYTYKLNCNECEGECDMELTIPYRYEIYALYDENKLNIIHYDEGYLKLIVNNLTPNNSNEERVIPYIIEENQVINSSNFNHIIIHQDEPFENINCELKIIQKGINNC